MAFDYTAYSDLIVWLDQQETYYRRNRMQKELKVIKEVRSKLAKVMDQARRRRKGWE